MGGSQYDQQPGMGANPPPGAEWQLGKTAASIQFVGEAEWHVREGLTTPDEEQMLGEAIRAVKEGERVLTKHLEVADFLVRGFDD